MMNAVAGRGGVKREACHQSRQPQSFSLLLTSFWDFGSPPEALRRHLLRCRGSRISRPCRCGDFGFGGTSQQNITFSVEASCITSCWQACLSFSERRCGVTECLQLRRRTRPPSFSAHTWRIFSVSSVEFATLAEEHSLGRARSWERRLVGKLACGGA